MGLHNVDNALAAIARGPPRRRAARARLRGAHGFCERAPAHGTARYGRRACRSTTILRTIRPRLPPRSRACACASGAERIIAVLEPRSHTMRAGAHRDTLADSLSGADSVWLYAPPDLGWDAAACLDQLGARAHVAR